MSEKEKKQDNKNNAEYAETTKEDNISCNYINEKSNKKFSIFEVVILIIISVTVSMTLGMIIVGHTKKNINSEPTKDKYLESFIENYNYIIDNYYEDVDKEQLINDAIAGMMNTLDDPYSAYITDDEANNFNINLQGSYKGLGLSVVKDPETKYIMVYYTFKDSPADKAGLKSGDLIKEIDGKPTNEIETTEFSNNVLKSDKNEYTLKIIRNNEEFDITISKENVVIDSVTSELIERNGKKIGYIYISIFANNTANQFKIKLKELEEQEIDALIIDVRSNTGGHLTAVEEILKSLLTTNPAIPSAVMALRLYKNSPTRGRRRGAL